jgi:hypothetical protein
VGAALRGDERRSFLLEGDSLTLLPGTEATALAADGTVVGSAEADGARHAFRWRAGALTGVVGANPGDAVLPAAVNASGVSVGTYARFAGSPHPASRAAFVWFASDALRLERLARHPEWEVVEAAGIDAHGRIAATARHRDTGAERAVLLTPR